jgi:nucleotide-binding universal stress UspA family protein
LIKKILVALDGSESADRALDFALDLAEKYSAEVVLLNVFQLVVVPMISTGFQFFRVKSHVCWRNSRNCTCTA